MNITVKQVQGRVPVTILETHGDLDASNYQSLIDAAQKIYQEGARDLLLDLGDTPLMGSSGLVALHSIALLLRGAEPPDPEAGWGAFHAIAQDLEGGFEQHFKLVNPQPLVDKTLEMTGFKTFLEVHTDLETAIASF